jgi:hypothetical protein
MIEEKYTKTIIASSGLASIADSIINYWNHFFSTITYVAVDAWVNTGINTIVGVSVSYVCLWLWRKILPTKKQKDDDIEGEIQD